MNLNRLVQTFYLLLLFLNGLVFMQPLSAASLNDGLVGYWSFDDCTANDNSNNGLSGTAYSGVSCVQSAWGKAFSFDGTNGYVEIPYPQAITGGSSFTASFLMQFNPLNKRQWVLFFGEPSRWVSAHWLIGENNISQFGFYSDGIAQGMYSLIDLSPFSRKWTHVVTTYDANTNQLISYINGVKQSTDYPAIKANLLPSKFYIGKNVYSASDANYSGNLDELRLYNRALSGLEVAQLYNSIQNHPVQYSANGHYYEYVPEVVDWNTAKQRAESKTYQGMKGHLATITSAEENNFITTSFPDNSGFLGATDVVTNGVWKWVTGEEFSYQNWNIGEPNNHCGNESYLQYRPNTNGKWNDIADDNQCYNLATYVSGYYVEYEPVTKFSDLVDMEKSGISFDAGGVVLYFKTIPEWFDVRLFIGGDLVSASPQLVADNQNPGAKYVIFKTNLQNIAYLNKLVEVKVWVKNAQTPVFGTVYGVIDQAKSTILASRTLSETKPTNNNECTTALGVSSPCNNYFVSDEIPDFNADETGYGANATFLETTTHRIIDFDKVVKLNNINATWNQSNYGRQPGGDNGRIPLLLVHGWQGTKALRNPAKLGLWGNSELHYWQHFLDYYLVTPELQKRYHLYLYHYPTYKHVTYNAKVLGELLNEVSQQSASSDLARPFLVSATKPEDGLTIIAHSMGGLVARSLVEEYQVLDSGAVALNQLNQLIMLDTPHHGSVASDPNVWYKRHATKDLMTQGASDLAFDNYDLSANDNDMQETKNRYRNKFNIVNNESFDKKFCQSNLVTCTKTLNSWLLSLNKKMESKAINNEIDYSSRYVLYAAWTQDKAFYENILAKIGSNTGKGLQTLNPINHDWGFIAAETVGVNDEPNGGAGPVTGALLSTYDPSVGEKKPLNPKCKDTFPPERNTADPNSDKYDWQNITQTTFSYPIYANWLVSNNCSSGFQSFLLRSIAISSSDARNSKAHPFKIPYRIFWGYDHEMMANGAYNSNALSDNLGVFDYWVPLYNKNNSSQDYVSKSKSVTAFNSNELRNFYIFGAASFSARTKIPTESNVNNSIFTSDLVMNPLLYEPLFMTLKGDLLAPQITPYPPKIQVPSEIVFTSNTMKISIYNAGQSDLVITSTPQDILFGVNSGAFAVLNLSEVGSCPKLGSGGAIGAGKSCTMSVVFRSNAPYAGNSREAFVQLKSNDPLNSVIQIKLMATVH